MSFGQVGLLWSGRNSCALAVLCTGVFVPSRPPDGSFLASHPSVQQLLCGNYLGFPSLNTTSENMKIATILKWQERRIIHPSACRKQCHNKAARDELRTRVVYCLAMPFGET